MVIYNQRYVRNYQRRDAGVVKRVSGKDVEVMLAKKVKKLERTMRLRKPEEKFFETSLSAVNISDTAGAVQSIVNVAQGADFNQRIGDTIRIHRIQGFVRVSTAAASLGAAPTGDEYLRADIVQDLQQVADTVAAAGTVWVLPQEPQNDFLNEALSHKRFKVLKSSPLWVAARLASSSTPVATLGALAPTQTAVWRFDFKCNIPVSYNSTAGTDFEKNGVFITWRSSIAADTADSDGRVRIYYTDL